MATDGTQRWAARPVQAALIRTLAFLVPIAGSIAFVHYGSRVVPVPTSSFFLFIAWWVLMSAAATVVLIAIDRVMRRLLPLVALYKLSLVFPDAAPSRFRVALRTGTADSLRDRIESAEAAGRTPVESAQQLLALVAELDAHDSLTRGHSERVRAYAQMIGGELHLSAAQLDLLNWAALLHDIGKLEVPTEILTKPGRPTDPEWEVLRRHPEYGDALVAPLRGWLTDWADAVPQHHERWDGQGYPRGLAGEEISLAARIVAVADAFDVITSVRSYKPGFASPAAREEIAACAGSQFDPRVVRAFLNVSLGRLRLVMGPLSWLAHAPILARIPLTPAIGAASGALATVATAVTVGAIATPPTPALATVTPHVTTVSAAPTRRVMGASETIRVNLEGKVGGAVVTLRITTPPLVGTAGVVGNRTLSYAAPAGYDGVVRIGYLACSAARRCVRGVVIITIRPPEEAPKPPGHSVVKQRHRPVEAVVPAPKAPAPRPPANEPPSAVDDPVSVPEAGTLSLDVLANDSDPDGDLLALKSIGSPARGDASIVSRRVRFVAPSDLPGLVSIPYTIVDSDGAESSARILATVQPVNDAPSFERGADQTVREDAGTQAVPGWATGIVGGPASEAGQHVGFQLTTSEPALFEAGGRPALTADGTFAFTPAANANGTASITVRAQDDGGTTYGGVDASAPQTLTVTITPVNDEPLFAAGADVTVLEDAGSQAVPGWATEIRPGPANEGDQHVEFVVTNSRPSLFTAGGQPALTSDGTLTFTPAANANGNASVTVRAKDDGGTTNGGADTSAPRTLTITVAPVNDLPVAIGDDATVAEDDVAGVTFDVLANDTDVESTGLVLDSYDDSTITNGTLTDNGGGSFTYLPDTGFDGTETFTYQVSDGSGGSATGTATITVTPIPHAPIAAADSYTTDEDTALNIAAPGLLANDSDPDGDPLTVATSPVSGPTNGALTLNADGSFDYTPTGGFAGTDSFVYTVVDGTGRTATATATITVNSTVSSFTLYFQPTGASFGSFDLTATPPPAAAPFADLGGDGNPGLTILESSGSESITDPTLALTWIYDVPAPPPLKLEGPVTLQLWSAIGPFGALSSGHIYAYLYDCNVSNACTNIAATDVFASPWNTDPLTWSFRSIAFGSVTNTIAASHSLRIKLLFAGADLWLTTTQDFPSTLELTVG